MKRTEGEDIQLHICAPDFPVQWTAPTWRCAAGVLPQVQALKPRLGTTHPPATGGLGAAVERLEEQKDEEGARPSTLSSTSGTSGPVQWGMPAAAQHCSYAMIGR